MAATLLEQITEDLGSKYDATFGFAESVTGPSGAFLGIFSNEYFQSDAGGYVGASSSVPFLRSRDANAMAKGATVTIRSASYVVVEVLPNGYGETIHRLQKS
jgi:hypothetical protein